MNKRKLLREVLDQNLKRLEDDLPKFAYEWKADYDRDNDGDLLTYYCNGISAYIVKGKPIFENDFIPINNSITKVLANEIGLGYEATLTSRSELLDNGKVLSILLNKDGEEVYFYREALRFWSNKEIKELEFEARGQRDLIIVYENNEAAAIILPFVYKKGGK